MGAETAIMPADAAFAHAAAWKIHVPQIENTLISFDYVGDIARVYAGDRLVTDDFYHGAPLEIGLWRSGPGSRVAGTAITWRCSDLPSARRPHPIGSRTGGVEGCAGNSGI